MQSLSLSAQMNMISLLFDIKFLAELCYAFLSINTPLSVTAINLGKANDYPWNFSAALKNPGFSYKVRGDTSSPS